MLTIGVLIAAVALAVIALCAVTQGAPAILLVHWMHMREVKAQARLLQAQRRETRS